MLNIVIFNRTSNFIAITIFNVIVCKVQLKQFEYESCIRMFYNYCFDAFPIEPIVKKQFGP